MGYHIHDWFAMVYLREPNSDYYEMTLHHIATIGSYYSAIVNNHAFGFAAMYLHDIADIFTTMSRVFTSTTLGGASVVSAIFLELTWIWTRLWVLPQCIYYLATVPCHEVMKTLWYFNFVPSCVLQLMHVYWFILITGMIVHKLKTGKAEDL
jgi:ceramide synthetase